MASSSLPPQSARTKYPGMRPREGQILRQWLIDHEHEYGFYEYNVRVGTWEGTRGLPTLNPCAERL
jgi:hypothetical protein